MADNGHEVVFDLIDESRRFIERLIDENERLGNRLSQLEGSGPGESLDALRERAKCLEFENEKLANLYVASYRLSGSDGLIPTLEVVREVIVNLIGSEDFVLLVRQHDADRYRAILANGVLASQSIEGVMANPRVSDALRLGVMQVAATTGVSDPVIAAVPLFAGAVQAGVIVIGKLLAQKPGLAPLDLEIFDLLGQQVAPRLLSGVAQRRLVSGVPAFDLGDFEGIAVAALPSHRV